MGIHGCDNGRTAFGHLPDIKPRESARIIGTRRQRKAFGQAPETGETSDAPTIFIQSLKIANGTYVTIVWNWTVLRAALNLLLGHSPMDQVRPVRSPLIFP